jgi:tripartite-type tricarboxylate transporter receptor subunit TctC
MSSSITPKHPSQSSTINRRNLNIGLASIAAGMMPTGLKAEDVADFYSGKRINLLVGYGTGGGFDVYARLLSRYMSRFIPGNPAIIVQNMPGAGSLVAVNYLYNVAPRDGTTIAHFGRNIVLLGALKSARAKFETSKLTWLGSSSSFLNDAYILLVRDDCPIRTIHDAIGPNANELVLGGSAEGSTSNDVPVILRDTIGLHFKLIAGYPDSSALFIAVERGEIQGRTVDVSSIRTIKPGWLKPGNGYRVLLQFGRETRLAEFSDVPTARELALDESARKLIELTELPYKLSRPFAAPPGIPPERAIVLQAAFATAHRDPQFLEEADRLGLDISPVDAEGVRKAISLIDTASPDALAYITKLFAGELR